MIDRYGTGKQFSDTLAASMYIQIYMLYFVLLTVKHSNNFVMCLQSRLPSHCDESEIALWIYCKPTRCQSAFCVNALNSPNWSLLLCCRLLFSHASKHV